MTDTTPLYGFPFPEDSDAPDGPAQLGALALAVETKIAAGIALTPSIIMFTANGSLTFAQYGAAKAVRFRMVGAGGAGGGAVATGVGESAGGGHGQGGHYAESVVPVATLGAGPYAVTVGAGGAGVSGGTGNTGGGSAVAGVISAAGGAGGSAMVTGSTVGTIAAGGSAGITAVGTVQATGGHGGNAHRIAASVVMHDGTSGASLLGNSTRAGASTSATGGTGQSYGGGGTGAKNAASQAARAGGDGAPGVVICELMY